MKNQLLNLIIFSLSFIFCQSSLALQFETSDDLDQLQLKIIKLSEHTEYLPSTKKLEIDKKLQVPHQATPDPPGQINNFVDKIINLGSKIWTIIENNKAVLDYETITASAVPANVSNWYELENWKALKTENYEVVYTNLLGMNVISMKVRLSYVYGGTYKGAGQYLKNVTIRPSDIDVVLAYTLDAFVTTDDPFNMNSMENPLAALPITLNWTVENALKTSKHSVVFLVKGNGNLDIIE